MANTTSQKVILIAPELKDADPNLIKLILDDVADEVGTSFGKFQEKAQRYLAAHYLTLSGIKSSNVTGAIKSQRTSEVAVTYGDEVYGKTRFDTTKYGKQYISIRDAAVLPFAVFTP